MFPKLDGIDHIHVYVANREKAAQWYKEMLGFRLTEAFAFWAEDPNGPLTIEDASGRIHLALFKRDDFEPSTAIAFGAGGKQFLQWKSLLDKAGILLRCSDHAKSWSLYFYDLDRNMHEITTYQYDYVAARLDRDG